MNQAELHRLLVAKSALTKDAKNLQLLFEMRLATNLTLIKELFFKIYPEEIHSTAFQKLIMLLTSLHETRPKELQLQDIERIKHGNWYQSQSIVGMQLYVNNFNKNLNGVADKIPYLEKLGVNLLHIMPITPRPKGENDGGYAVNNYHAVDKQFGTKEDLLKLSKKLRSKRMYLMLDFVVNHTSNEFSWAKKAQKGDIKYQKYYYTYPDRNIPDQYEQTLPEIFPKTSPGNFTYNPKMQRWVMTVFNSYQWDLNYTNPEVFLEMLDNLLQLVNSGVDIIRLDALAFLWKKLGTPSQNLPEAHTLISLFRMCLQVIAPSTIFLAEAIVSPPEIIKYFGEGIQKGNECEVAYNATLMALLWDAIATKKTIMLTQSLKNLPKKPAEATWINYIRCHDDIGLGFEDQYLYEIGWDAQQHRRFLLDYYCGGLDWSPAKGLVFMYNPKNGDGRITGSAASLLGLEKAFEDQNPELVQQAIDKIILLHSIILSYGGIPMIYAGDEIGTLNDYTFLNDKNKKEDNRWANRPFHDWREVADLDKKESPQSKLFYALKNLIAIRKKTPIFADNNNFILHKMPNQHILVYERTASLCKGILVVSNLSDETQYVALPDEKRTGVFYDLITKRDITLYEGELYIQAYQAFWLQMN